ncbi:MAG: DeoR family transcriptional regulator [Melioribacteraceae bacterium]|nr:DeoR family transcriptional regulator [Melioribacteraceae bacterium]
MGGLTIEKLKSNNYSSVHRNKLLTEAFYLTNDIEKYGTGFKRIFSWLKSNSNLNIDIYYSNDFFKIDLIETVNATVNERQKKIIDNIKKQKSVTVNELAKYCNVSRDTIMRDIKKT